MSAVRKVGADIFDPRQSLCEGQNCIYQINGVSLYVDNSHIARNGVGILEANLGETLADAYYQPAKVDQKSRLKKQLQYSPGD
jgi:hypothetical protein